MSTWSSSHASSSTSCGAASNGPPRMVFSKQQFSQFQGFTHRLIRIEGPSRNVSIPLIVSHRFWLGPSHRFWPPPSLGGSGASALLTLYQSVSASLGLLPLCLVLPGWAVSLSLLLLLFFLLLLLVMLPKEPNNLANQGANREAHHSFILFFFFSFFSSIS